MIRRAVFFLCSILLFAQLAWGEVFTEAHNRASATNTSSESFSLAATKPTLVLVGVEILNSTTVTVTAATYGGSNLTLVAGITQPVTSAGTRSYLYYMNAPPSGTQTVAVTLSGNCNHVVLATSFTGTPLTAALEPAVSATGTTSPANTTVSLKLGQLAFDTIAYAASAATASLSPTGYADHSVATDTTHAGGAQHMAPPNITAVVTESVLMSYVLGGTPSSWSKIAVAIRSDPTKNVAASQLVNPTFAGKEAHCWGSSNAQGIVGFGMRDTQNGFCYQVARSAGLSLVNHAISGTTIDSQVTAQIMGQVIQPGAIHLSDLGTVDFTHYPSVTGGTADDFYSFRNLAAAAVAWLAIPDQGKIWVDNALCSTTGSWSVGSPGWHADKYTTSVGATLTCPVNGTAVYIWYLNWRNSNNGGKFKVTIDGVDYGEPGCTPAPCVDANAGRATKVGQIGNYRPELFRVGGLEPGTHTVTVTSVTGTDATHFVEIEAMASPTSWYSSTAPSTAEGPQVYLMSGYRIPTASYATYSTNEALANAYRDMLTGVARMFRGDGLRVSPIDSTYYDPNSTLCGDSGDGIHLGICAHKRLADAFLREMNVGAPTGHYNPAWDRNSGQTPLNLGPAAKPKTANYQITAKDDLISCDPTAGNLTMTLPDARQATRLIAVKNVGSANVCTVATRFSQLIDDGSTVSLNSIDQTAVFVSNGTGWLIYGSHNQGAPVVLTSNVAIANTETRVLGFTMLSNRMSVGTTFRGQIGGFMVNTTTASTSVARVRIGSTTLTGNIMAQKTWANGTTARATGQPFQCNFSVTVRTIGASGTAIGWVRCDVANVTQPVVTARADATAVVDTTANKEVEFTFISGAASTTFTFTSGYIEIVRP